MDKKEMMTMMFIGFLILSIVVLASYGYYLENKYNQCVVDYYDLLDTKKISGSNTWQPQAPSFINGTG